MISFKILGKYSVLDLQEIYYADFNSSLNLSAIIAINSELVVFPFAADMVYPKMLSTVSAFPLPQATLIVWQISLFTPLGVV